mmetsp:Transcript_14350/g.36271  ORF Transcript_14350/g.36271 Transcript_14350/m.36271 type:complete len:643 (-) Transcript_14350:546-2474(-)
MVQDRSSVIERLKGATEPSLQASCRMLMKLGGLAAVGVGLTKTWWLSPVGLIVLATAAGWVTVIGEECAGARFFPQQPLNAIGAKVFRWQWLGAAAAVILAVSVMQAGKAGAEAMIDVSLEVVKISLVPLALMHLGRAVEPYRLSSTKKEMKKAEEIVREVVGDKQPLVQLDTVPLYKLGSVAVLLRELVAELADSEKLKVQLCAPEKKSASVLGVLYAPFRSLAREVLLWESRDIVFHVMVVLYLSALYVGSFHHPWVPLGVLLPFMAPKSRAARYLHKLQEDLRKTQGAVVAPKVGLKPPKLEGSETWVSSMNWPMVAYITTVHTLALYAVTVAIFFGGVCPLSGGEQKLKGSTWALAVLTYLISALGITAGVHRLWAHKSYKASLPLRVFLMLCNSVASQGTIYHWARDHRVHHLYSDTAADPHDATRGFFFSHAGWMLTKKRPEVIAAGKSLSMADLEADPVVMFQKRADPFWNLLLCFFMPAYVATMLGDSFWNGFLIAGVLRYACILNATWAVNSVVHAFGEKPYNPGHMTTENGWVALATIGEGWHNWHHAFDWDYAAAEMGASSQFNPTKMFIDLMAKLGQVWGRKRAHHVWELRKQRWAEQQGRSVVEAVEGPWLFRRRVVIFGPAYDEQESD